MPKTVNVNKNQVAKKEKEMPTTMKARSQKPFRLL